MAHIIHLAFLIFLSPVEILCNNTTGKYNTMDAKSFQSKFHRFLSFNTQDNGDISMEMSFSVPFITIPVKKSIDSAKGAIANVNIGAIVLGGAIAFGFGVVIPGILLLMKKKMFNSGPKSETRSEESQQWWHYVHLVDQILTENDIDTTSCMQKVVCWAVQNSDRNVLRGHSSSSDKIIDGLATNMWLQKMVEGTVIHSALQSGLGKTDCSKEYHQCKISEESMQMLTKQFTDHFV